MNYSAHLPILISCVTLVAIWLQGIKWRHAWGVSLGNQALWLSWIVMTQTWGFLLLTIALTGLYAWNHFLWLREDAASTQGPGLAHTAEALIALGARPAQPQKSVYTDLIERGQGSLIHSMSPWA